MRRAARAWGTRGEPSNRTVIQRETERREAAEPGTPRGFLKRTIVKTMTNVKSRPVTSHLGSQSPETALATPVRAVPSPSRVTSDEIESAVASPRGPDSDASRES